MYVASPCPLTQGIKSEISNGKISTEKSPNVLEIKQHTSKEYMEDSKIIWKLENDTWTK